MEPFLLKLVGGLAAVLGALVLVLLVPRRKCLQCDKPLPGLRPPGSSREAMRGGWRCQSCNASVDRNGRPRPGEP